MAGIYIHIPYCRQACIYCDFHFSTKLDGRDELLKCLVKEIELRNDYLHNERIETIYIGGGTPSLLDATEINLLLKKIYSSFNVEDHTEITLEANPDDLTYDKCKSFFDTGINRISLGIQSFSDADLKWMSRIHNNETSLRSIENIRKAGFENYSVDLIYGAPVTSENAWKENLRIIEDLRPPHLSAYALTVEEKTVLDVQIRKKKIQSPVDTDALRHYDLLLDMISKTGYEQYEISNFCRDGFYSKHNSSYWKSKKYLGIGPSAHSFNGTSRSWNIKNNSIYIREINNKNLPLETEYLSDKDRVNEIIMTRLRTKWGLDLEEVEKDFGQEIQSEIKRKMNVFLERNELILEDKILLLSRKGQYIADRISSELFID